jgi:uncharacterized membrane protein
MNWAEFATQWLHIFFGIFWFGSVLFADFVLLPAILTLPDERQPAIMNAIAARGDRIIPFVAAATIVLGVLRGIFGGPIRDVASLGTEYGVYWLIGLIAAVATFVWGYLGAEQRKRFATESAQWTATGNEMPAGLVAQRGRIRLMLLVELAGFLVIFTTMILMHFAAEG